MAGGEIALAPCLTCSTLISVEASTCPNCDLRITEVRKREMLQAARFQATGNQTKNGLWIAARVQETNNWRVWTLNNASKLRDLVLVAVVAPYAVRFVVWSIHALNNDLGFLPIINSQYLIAGLPPVIFLSLCIVFVSMYSGGQQPIRLNAAAGGAGGSWYVLLEGLAKLIYDINPNLEIQVVEGGGISNHENVGLGRIPMAILNPPMTAAALAGRPPFEHPHSDLRVGISNLSVNYLQFVVAQGIHLASLEEWPQTGYPLRMPVDRAGTVDRMVFELALQHLGMSDQGTEGWTSRLVPTRNYNEQLALYAREETDGFWQFMAMPSPSIEAGHSIRPLKFLSLPQDFIQKLEQLGWTSAKLPEGAYDVIEKPVVTVSMGTSLGFHASVPDDVVFTIVEAVCEHPDRVQAVHPAALGFDPEQAYLGAGGPLHPGAEKYFRTKGWSA